MHRYLRVVSPYLLFLALLLIFLSVTLHKTYNYGHLAGNSLELTQPVNDPLATDSAQSTQAHIHDGAGKNEPSAVALEIPIITQKALEPGITVTEMTLSDTNHPTPTGVNSAEVVQPKAKQHPKTFTTGEAAAELGLMNVGQLSNETSSALAGPGLGSSVLELVETSNSIEQSSLVRGVTFAAVLILSLVAILKAIVMQTKRKTVSPAVFTIIAVLIVFGAYFLASSSSLPPVSKVLVNGSAQ
jgi:hypothetical protein